jgi:hypothetical protein
MDASFARLSAGASSLIGIVHMLETVAKVIIARKSINIWNDGVAYTMPNDARPRSNIRIRIDFFRPMISFKPFNKKMSNVGMK